MSESIIANRNGKSQRSPWKWKTSISHPKSKSRGHWLNQCRSQTGTMVTSQNATQKSVNKQDRTLSAAMAGLAARWSRALVAPGLGAPAGPPMARYWESKHFLGGPQGRPVPWIGGKFGSPLLLFASNCYGKMESLSHAK